MREWWSCQFHIPRSLRNCYGLPEIGKTLLARAVANIRVVGNEVVQKYAGERARMVRELFQVRMVTMRWKRSCLRSSTSLMALMLVAISVEILDGNEQVPTYGAWHVRNPCT